MGEFRCLPASTSNQQFSQSFPTKSLACIALTMQEATNISIEAAGSQHAGRDSSSNERLTPLLGRVTSGTPAREFLARPSSTDEKIIKGDKAYLGKVVSPEGRGNVVDPASPDLDATVDSITFPVMCMSIDDAIPLQLDSDDPDPLTESSFRETYATAEAVTSFLDRQLRHQHDRYGGGPAVDPPGRPGRFQRRNSFVVHNKKRSRSLEDRDGPSGPGGAGTSRAGETAAGSGPAGKPRFDVRSQSEGTLMGPTSTPVAPPLGLHRLSLPWKRKKAESPPGPASSTHG